MVEYGSSLFYRQTRNYGNISNFHTVPHIGLLTLPDELDISPHFLSSAKNKHGLQRDLIVLAEFSEIEGPVPRLCIPSDASHDIDLNDFVLQLMATDFQGLGHLDFQIYQDTCLFQEDRDRGVFTYVHYFTLFDVRARGFVRPLCLAYVSGESEKIPRLLTRNLKENFNKVTEYLRVGNLIQFERELKWRIDDLLYTKDKFIELKRRLGSDAEDNSSETLDCGNQTSNIDSNLDSKLDGDELNKFHISFYEKESHESSESTDTNFSSSLLPVPLSLSYGESQLSSSLPVAGVSANPLAPVHSELPLFIKPKETKRKGFPNIESRESSCIREVIEEEVEKPESDSFSTESDNSVDKEECNDDQNGLTKDDVAALEHTSLEALAVQILDCQRIMDAVLSYLGENQTKSDIKTFLTELESQPLSPLFKELTATEVLMQDSAHKPEKPSIFVISLMRRCFRNMRPFNTLCGLGYVAAVAKLLDMYNSFSKSVLTLIFEDLDREIYDNSDSSLFIGNIPVVNVGCGFEPEESSEDIKNNQKTNFESHMSFKDFAWNDDLVVALRSDPTEEAKSTVTDTKTIQIESNEAVAVADDCLRVFSADDSRVDSDRKSILDNESERGSVNSQSSESLVLLKEKTYVFNDLECGWREVEEEEEQPTHNLGISGNQRHDIHRRMVDAKLYRLSSLIQQFSGVSQCILETLLCGKTLVVAGPELLKKVVQLHTKALSSLLPIKLGQNLPVLRWHTGTIVNWHVETYKIIGVCIPERLHVQDLMSNSTLNRVTVLNVETGHLSGVAYTGELLRKADQLCRRQFRSEGTLQSIIQDLMVTLGREVILYIHSARTSRRSSKDILKGIGVHRGDWDIVKYLAHVAIGK